jgi:hypothetical protein
MKRFTGFAWVWVTLALGIVAAIAIGRSPAEAGCPMPTVPPGATTAPPGSTTAPPNGSGGGPGGPGGTGPVVTSSGPPPGAAPPPGTTPTGTGPSDGSEPTVTISGPSLNGCPVLGPEASAKDKAKLYGKYCRGESHKRVRGRESPFTKCLTAMATLASASLTQKKTTPAKACKALSRRPLAGRRKTPYALCVAGGKKLLHDVKSR